MKHLKLFFALFAMLALGVGNAWGAETLYKTALFGANYNSKKVSSYTDTWTATNDGFVVTVVNANNNNNGWTYIKMGRKSYTSVGSITTQAAIDKPISKITMTIDAITANNINSIKLKTSTNGSSFVEAGTFTISKGDKSVTINNPTANLYYQIEVDCKTGSNGSIQISKVQYYATEDAGSGGDEPVASLTATPTTIDFGTVYQDATVADKTVAVNFANLTGDVTYSGLSTPFSATGNISTTGDNITISADASTIGEYSQTLTVASTADSKTAEVTVKMNVVEKPAPTGTFTLHTGALVEGDYVIVSTNSLKAEVNSDRLASLPVTISNDEIVDPDATTIWHIAKSGEYWTLYNANKAKYAASTGAKNKAALLNDATDDKALWSVTGTSTYEFVNKKNTEAAVNANLRYNSQNAENSRWACYSTGTGAALSLYRKAGTKYNVNISATTNGKVTAPTSAEAGTTITLTVTPEGGYVLDALTVTDASSNPVTVTNNEFTMPASDVTVTATFKLNEKPAATLTLSKNGVTELLPGDYKQDEVVTLPDFKSDCSKTFVGWSENPNCNTEPEYKAGESYQLKLKGNQTLYAVYADTKESTITEEYAFNTFTSAQDVTFNSASFTVELKKGNGATNPAWNAGSSEARIYAKGQLVIKSSTPIVKVVYTYTINANNSGKKPTIDGVAGKNSAGTWDADTKTWTGSDSEITLSTSGEAGNIGFKKVAVTMGSIGFENYSTDCAAAPTAEVNPTEVTATAAEATGKVTVAYDNVNKENVTIVLFNDAACTEEFTAGWLTVSLDGDKNVTYTVSANTLYTERKAYIQLTAPETTGATGPAVVVIPVTQAGKDKVFASLAELVAADLAKDDAITVTLTNDVIKEFYVYNSKRAGVVFDVQKDGKDIKIYFDNQTTIGDWAEGGKLSGTLTNVKWTTYNSAWQLAPANTWAWANLTYTEPKAVSTVVVSGTPTKTTYVDGEAFDPAGLTVTVNYNDATSEENPTGVTFNVTPATLTKGQTSVNVTATYNSISSAAYEVTGLTVNDIPTKTIAEFIAARGTRCYLEGIVSGLAEGNSMKYGNFDLTDASETIYVYGCLNASGEKEKFAELGVKNGDKIKVIADELTVYNSKDQAKNVQYVSHISAASITVENITMEVDEVATITATVDPADAVVTYTIKENEANAISLEGNTIKALAEGTATITATVEEGATYLGNSVDFTVTVGPKTESEEVVILAELDGTWYAMKGAVPSGKTNQLDAIEVTYFNGTLYNVPEEVKASITWTRTVVGDKVTFVNNGKYLKGGTSTNLNLAETVDDNCKWMWNDENGYYTTNTSGTIRTFLYRVGYNFKNYGASQAGQEDVNGNYSELPVVTAPVYKTGDVTYTRATTAGKFGTICLPFGSTNYTGAEFFEFVGSETGKVYIGSVDELVAGVPYIFLASAAQVVVTSDGTTAATPGNSNGLYGTFTNDTEVAIGNYILKDNALCLAEAICWVNAYRAYIVMSEVPTEPVQQMPGRRYIGMDVEGENEATGLDNIQLPNANSQKLIINGQLIIIRDGEMYNAMGVKL